MKLNREIIEQELEKLRGQRGIGSVEQQVALLVLSLQIQLEILDVLNELEKATSKVDREPYLK